MKNGPYELVIAPEAYPGRRYRGRYVYEHHLVWWRNTGMLVPDGGVVHHVNGMKRDNRFENLELQTRSHHSAEHGVERGTGEFVPCHWCGKDFFVAGNQLRHRKKQSKNGRLFCCRSHQAKQQQKDRRESIPP